MNKKRQKLKTGISHDFLSDYEDEYGNIWTVAIEIKALRGRQDISGMSIWQKNHNKPLTRRLLNQIPLDQLFRSALTEYSQDLRRFVKSKNLKESHRGQPFSEEELELVARIYQAAFKARKPVQQAVADACGISISAAGKRIYVARQRGFISTHKNVK